MMSEPHTLQLAIKYACRLKYMQLAERISEVVQRKSAEQAEEVEEEEEEVVHRVQRSRSSVKFNMDFQKTYFFYVGGLFNLNRGCFI